MNWILGGLAVLFVGPALLRAAAANPDALKYGAGALDKARAKTIDLSKRGAKAAYEQGRAFAKSRGYINGLGLAPADHVRLGDIARMQAAGYADMVDVLLSSGGSGAVCGATAQAVANAMYNIGIYTGHAMEDSGKITPSLEPTVKSTMIKVGAADAKFRERCTTGGRSSGRRTSSRSGSYDVEF